MVQKNLRQRATKGFFWNAIENFSNQGISFVFTIVLARILLPSDYGIIAMVSIFFAIARTIVNCGFGAALIRKKDRDEKDLNTCFYFNIFVAAGCYLLLFLSSPIIANFYNQQILDPLVKVAGLSLVINSFGIIQQVQFTYKLDFRSTAVITLISNIIGGICAIGFAYANYGVWSLVFKEMITSIISTCLFWFKSPWRPQWIFSWTSFHYLFGFGSKLLASYMIGIIYENIYPLVIGKFFTPVQLGYYSRALGFAQLPATNITGIFQRVTFPLLSEIQDDDSRLENIYRRLLRISAFVIFPIMIGISAVASPLVRVLLTEKWDGCVLYLQIICLGLMWYPIHAINLNLLQVKGRSDLFLRLEIIKKILGVIIMCISIPFGITCMCVGLVVSSLISLLINTYYTEKLIHVGFVKQILDISPTLFISLIMGGLIFWSTTFIDIEPIKLFVGIILGSVLYFLFSYFFNKRDLKEVFQFLKIRKQLC